MMSDTEEAFLLVLESLVAGMEDRNTLAARISDLIAEYRAIPAPVINVTTPEVRVDIPARQTLVITALPRRIVKVNRDRSGRITSMDIE